MCHFFGDIVWVGVAAVQILCDVGLLNLMALFLRRRQAINRKKRRTDDDCHYFSKFHIELR